MRVLLKSLKELFMMSLLAYMVAIYGQHTYTYVDTVGRFILNEKCYDSLCVINIKTYSGGLCLYEQGLCIDTIRISFVVEDVVHCSRKSFSLIPGNGAVYECSADTTLFIYVNMGIDSIVNIECSDPYYLWAEIFGDSVILKKEKECRFLAYKYKLMFLTKCLWKVYDCVGIYGVDMHALILRIYCFSIVVLSKSERIISNISNSIQINADFSFCE